MRKKEDERMYYAGRYDQLAIQEQIVLSAINNTETREELVDALMGKHLVVASKLALERARPLMEAMDLVI